MLLLLNLFQAK